MKEFVESLDYDKTFELMDALCRSGKIIIPQYYVKEAVIDILDTEVTPELMYQIQENFEHDWDLHEIIESKIRLFAFDEIED